MFWDIIIIFVLPILATISLKTNFTCQILSIVIYVTKLAVYIHTRKERAYYANYK